MEKDIVDNLVDGIFAIVLEPEIVKPDQLVVTNLAALGSLLLYLAGLLLI